MIEQRGRVVAVADQEVWVRGMPESACGACSLKAGCGRKLLSGPMRQVRVVNELDVRLDDEVIIGIPEQALLKASLLLYLIPSLTMLLLALITHHFLSAQDGWVLLAAVVGLGLGFGLARRMTAEHRMRSETGPRLLRRLAPAQAWMPADTGTLELEGLPRER